MQTPILKVLVQFFMEINSYGLGYHNRQLDSRNQSFPICKRNPGITNPRTKATTNRREAINNQILPTMPRRTGHPKILNDQMHQDAMLCCRQTNRAHYARSMSTTNLSVPSWVVLNRPLEMRFNMPPIQRTKPNPTQHHKDLLLWCSKTRYHSKDWW